MANTVDLRTLAKANLVATSSRSLAGLTACLLGKQLPKDNIRFSRWGCPHLSDAQRDYATRDAVASVLVYEAMYANREPIVRAPPEPDDVGPGSKVRLYNTSHSACVAVGDVVVESTALAALDHWKSAIKLVGPSLERLRAVVKITEVKVPSAFVQHALSPPAPVPADGWQPTSKRCTIGEVAPAAPFGRNSATRTREAGEQREGDGVAEVVVGDSRHNEAPESDEDLHFHGLVLWDITHMRKASSYKPPLYDLVDESGVEYSDNFNYEDLPTGKIVQGGDTDAGEGEASNGDEEDDEWTGPPFGGEGGVMPQPRSNNSDAQGTTSTPAAAATSSTTTASDATPISSPPTAGSAHVPRPSAAAGASSVTAASDACPSSGPPVSGSAHVPGSLLVRLDGFHGITRITKLVPKSHGAFHFLCALLRDAFFMVNKADIEAMESILKSQGKTDAEIAKMKDKDWSFLRNARRRVPAPDILRRRFDAVITACKDIRDAKTGEVLLSPAAMKAAGLVRDHIDLGCFSDPDGVPLYYERVKTSSGHTYYRCVRGTNSTEGYHRYLRTLFANFCASPWVCHSVLMEFNYRWNISRAVDNRGMAAEIGGFSHQYLIDQIQRVTASWYPGQPLYPEWLAPVDFEDSGERTGLASSVLTFDGKPLKAAPEDGLSPDMHNDEDPAGNDNNRVDQRLPAPQQLLPSARHLATLMNHSLPITPVSSRAEKRKFKEEFFQYFRQGGSSSARDHQNIDYGRWTADWNETCRRIEAGEERYLAINRKTATQLSAYTLSFREQLNFVNTMAPLQGGFRQLSSSLRQQASPELFTQSVGVGRMPAPDRSLGGSLTSTAVAAAVSAAAAAAATAATAAAAAGTGAAAAGTGTAGEGGPAGTGATGASTPGCYGGSAHTNEGSRGKAPVSSFRACATCGHHKGAWPMHHPGPRSKQAACSMPEDQRRAQSEMEYRRAGKRRVFPPCLCNICRGSYAES